MDRLSIRFSKPKIGHQIEATSSYKSQDSHWNHNLCSELDYVCIDCPFTHSPQKIPSSRARLSDGTFHSADTERRNRRRNLDDQRPTKNDSIQASPMTLRHPDLSRIRKSSLYHQVKLEVSSLSPDRPLRSLTGQPSLTSQTYNPTYGGPALYIDSEPIVINEMEKIHSAFFSSLSEKPKRYSNERFLLHNPQNHTKYTPKSKISNRKPSIGVKRDSAYLSKTREQTNVEEMETVDKKDFPRHSHVRYQAHLQKGRVSDSENVSRESIEKLHKPSTVESFRLTKRGTLRQSVRTSIHADRKNIFNHGKRSVSSSPRTQDREYDRKITPSNSYMKQTPTALFYRTSNNMERSAPPSSCSCQTSVRAGNAEGYHNISHSTNRWKMEACRSCTDAYHCDLNDTTKMRNIYSDGIGSSTQSVHNQNDYKSRTGFSLCKASRTEQDVRTTNKRNEEYKDFSNTVHMKNYLEPRTSMYKTSFGLIGSSHHVDKREEKNLTNKATFKNRNGFTSSTNDPNRFSFSSSQALLKTNSSANKVTHEDSGNSIGMQSTQRSEERNLPPRYSQQEERFSPFRSKGTTITKQISSDGLDDKRCLSHRCNKCTVVPCESYTNDRMGCPPKQSSHQLEIPDSRRSFGTHTNVENIYKSQSDNEYKRVVKTRHSLLPILNDNIMGTEREKHYIASLSTENTSQSIFGKNATEKTSQFPEQNCEMYSKNPMHRNFCVGTYTGECLSSLNLAESKHGIDTYDHKQAVSFTLSKRPHHTSTQTPPSTSVTGYHAKNTCLPVQSCIPNYSTYKCDRALINNQTERSTEAQQQTDSRYVSIQNKTPSENSAQKCQENEFYVDGTSVYYNQQNIPVSSQIAENNQFEVPYCRSEEQLRVFVHNSQTNTQPNDQTDQSFIENTRVVSNDKILQHNIGTNSCDGTRGFGQGMNFATESNGKYNICVNSVLSNQQGSSHKTTKQVSFPQVNNLINAPSDFDKQPGINSSSGPEKQEIIYLHPDGEGISSRISEGGYISLPQNASYEIVIKHSDRSIRMSSYKKSAPENENVDFKYSKLDTTPGGIGVVSSSQASSSQTDENISFERIIVSRNKTTQTKNQTAQSSIQHRNYDNSTSEDDSQPTFITSQPRYNQSSNLEQQPISDNTSKSVNSSQVMIVGVRSKASEHYKPLQADNSEESDIGHGQFRDIDNEQDLGSSSHKGANRRKLSKQASKTKINKEDSDNVPQTKKGKKAGKNKSAQKDPDSTLLM